MTDPIPDAELVEHVLAGSAEALAALYDQHAAGVYRAAWALLRSTADAEDVVQDVFLGLPHAIRGYSARGPLGAWIRRVAVRAALMRLRTQRRRREQPIDPLAGSPVPQDAPVDRLALKRAIDALPEGLRLVFVLKVVEGYSHQNVAALLGITPETSKVRLFRARKLLQDMLS